MIIRSKAPLRLGFAGGGTDVSPFSDIYGGFILNATIDRYVYCTIEETSDDSVTFCSSEKGEQLTLSSGLHFPLNGKFDLHKGIYNRIVKDFVKKPLSFKMTTHSDVVTGSGLGGSSTLVVAIIQAFTEWLNLPLGEYDIAHLAFEIERIDVGLAGGKQDQYAATFGGFNFMEFYQDRVVVNPLSIKNWIVSEMESAMLIYFTGLSREGADVIHEQIDNVNQKNEASLNAMHQLKKDALAMKEALLTGHLGRFAAILDSAWHTKKKMATSITNPRLEEIYLVAKEAGAMAGKLSGAGGGGYIMFMVSPTKRKNVIHALEKFGGNVDPFHFTQTGASSWTLNKGQEV